MARHHYVPQFLLRRWATNGLLYSYRWNAAANRVSERPRTSVARACQIEDLNSFTGLVGPGRDAPEHEFFTPLVDTPAARACTVLLTQGVTGLTLKQREAWARLLISFAVRTPETLLSMGPAEFRKAMEIARVKITGPPDVDARATEFIKREMLSLERNVPIRVAMDLTSEPAKCDAVATMHWWLRRVPCNTILVGDRPLLAYPRVTNPCGIPLDNPDCLIALPVAPDTVFFASRNTGTRAKVRRAAHGRLARIVNEETIWRAAERVYMLDGSMSDFIKTRLAGKASGTWQPLAL